MPEKSLAVFEGKQIRRHYDEETVILIKIIPQEWADISVTKHKEMKGLKTQNLSGV